MLLDLGIGDFKEPDPAVYKTQSKNFVLVPISNIHAVAKIIATSIGNQVVEMRIKIDVCGFEKTFLSDSPIDVFLNSITVRNYTELSLSKVFMTDDNLCPIA